MAHMYEFVFCFCKLQSLPNLTSRLVCSMYKSLCIQNSQYTKLSVSEKKVQSINFNLNPIPYITSL